MRGNSDRDVLYPFTVAPRNGWGHENPTNEHIIADARAPGKGVVIEPDGNFRLVSYEECTPFPTAADAAVAAGHILAKIRAPEQGQNADQHKAAA